MKLYEFKKINEAYQINKSDYLVIVSYINVTNKIKLFENTPNVFKVGNEYFWVVLRKGLYKKMEDHWKEIRRDKTKLKSMLPPMTTIPTGEIMFFNIIHNQIDLLVYDSLEGLVKDCDVFTYHEKTDVDVSNGEMLALLIPRITIINKNVNIV